MSPLDPPPPSDRAAAAYAPQSWPDPLVSRGALAPEASVAPAVSTDSARARTPRGLLAVAFAAVLALIAIVALDPLGKRARPHVPARNDAPSEASQSARRAPSALSAS